MARDALETASNLMRRRKFSDAIKLLESRSENFENNFNYSLLLGIAYLYDGDGGSAWKYFGIARKIKLTDSSLSLGYAAIFLRRGETRRAIQYYNEILDYDPKNKTAKAALEFIRLHGDYDTICRWADSGKLKKFYPPIGINYVRIIKIVLFSMLCCAVMVGAAFVLSHTVFTKKVFAVNGPRANLEGVSLTQEELREVHDSEIDESYRQALVYFQSHRDNAAQMEINKILSSTASTAVKNKARRLAEYFEVPTFDSLTDNPEYSDVVRNPHLYLNCYVVWNGRITNVQKDETGYRCDLLVGYDTMERVDGIVPVRFSSVPEISPDRSVRILAKITSENGRMILEGRAVYQSIEGVLQTR